MKIGFSRTTINPFLPCHLEGYQDRIANKIHDDLYLNTLCIKGKQTILIHILDVVIIEKELYEYLSNSIYEKYNCMFDQIFISAIHTHSGPKVSHKIDKNISLDEKYIKFLKRKILENTEEAVKNLIECKVFLGKNKINDVYSNRNHIYKYFQNEAMLISFKRIDLTPIVDVVNLACHPTVLNGTNLEVSSDYVGYLRKHYEDKTHIPLVFANSECGDISTRLMRKGTDFKECERVGTIISNKIQDIYDLKEIDMEDLEIHKCNFYHTYKPSKNEFIQKMLYQLKNPKKYFIDSDIRYKLKNRFIQSLENKLQFETIELNPTAYIITSKDLNIVTFPGELVSNLGFVLRNASSKELFILSYTNDYYGYAVDESQYGLYFETFESDYPYGIVDKFVEKISEELKKIE